MKGYIENSNVNFRNEKELFFSRTITKNSSIGSRKHFHSPYYVPGTVLRASGMLTYLIFIKTLCSRYYYYFHFMHKRAKLWTWFMNHPKSSDGHRISYHWQNSKTLSTLSNSKTLSTLKTKEILKKKKKRQRRL